MHERARCILYSSRAEQRVHTAAGRDRGRGVYGTCLVHGFRVRIALGVTTVESSHLLRGALEQHPHPPSIRDRPANE